MLMFTVQAKFHLFWKKGRTILDIKTKKGTACCLKVLLLSRAPHVYRIKITIVMMVTPTPRGFPNQPHCKHASCGNTSLTLLTSGVAKSITYCKSSFAQPPFPPSENSKVQTVTWTNQDLYYNQA